MDLYRKGATTVCPLASIGINNNFPAGETSVPVRASDNEFAGRVDEIFSVAGKESGQLRGEFLDARNENTLDVSSNFSQHASILVKIIVLRGNYDGFDSFGTCLSVYSIVT
jgi:hypothetical protein